MVATGEYNKSFTSFLPQDAACLDADCSGDVSVSPAEWDEFKTLDWETIYKSMNKPAFVFDGRL